MKPKVAFIGTGGTIASLGATPLDVQDYGSTGNRMHADETIAMYPPLAEIADIIPIRYNNIVSPGIVFEDWRQLVLACDKAVADHPDLAGIVIGHGTASLEETAYALNLAVKVDIPVVIVGSQRPSSAMGTDAAMNLAGAIRTAASPASRGMGVLVCLNDEIQSGREVTKTSTFRMQTFRTPDFGVLGHADADRVSYYRAPVRRRAPDTVFDIRGITTPARVDIAYAYAGSDGVAVRAFIAAGAKGIVSAGFAPSFPTPDDTVALAEAAKQGIVVALSTRAGSGRVFAGQRAKANGFISADNLNPQKARILLTMALTITSDPAEISKLFEEY